MDQLTKELNKRTVAELKEHCLQRSLPVTPVKKSDLVNRLVLFLKDRSDDELCKLTQVMEEHPADEQENAVNEQEHPLNPADKQKVTADEKELPVIEEIMEEPSVTGHDDVSLKTEEHITEVNRMIESEKNDQDVQYPEETHTAETSKVTGEEDVDDEGKHTQDKTATMEAEVEVKECEEGDNTQHKIEHESHEKDSELAPKQEETKAESQEKEPTSRKKAFKGERPSRPDDKTLHNYLHIDSRRRYLVVYPVSVPDLARKEIQEFLSGDVEDVHYVFRSWNDINGHILVKFKTLQETQRKVEYLPKHNKSITVERLSSGTTCEKVLNDAFPETREKLSKRSRMSSVPLQKRTLCAFFIPEGTSEKELRSHFGEPISILWARDEDAKYDGMVFFQYESEEAALEQFKIVIKKGICYEGKRMWVTRVNYTQDPTVNAMLKTRKSELEYDLSNEHKLSAATKLYLQQQLKKTEQKLENSGRDQALKKALGKKKGQLRKQSETNVVHKKNLPNQQGKGETNVVHKKNLPHPQGKGETNVVHKKILPNQQGKGKKKQKQGNTQQKKGEKRPFSMQDGQYGRQNQQQPNKKQRWQLQFQQQRSPEQGAGKWKNQKYGRNVVQSPLPPPRPDRERGFNQEYGCHRTESSSGSRFNTQATANAVSLLVGLGSLIGGSARRRSGGDMESHYDDRNQLGSWSGGYFQGPVAKRGRYSEGNQY